MQGQLIIEAQLRANEGCAEQFAQLLRDTAQAASVEEGCVAYRFTRNLDDPRTFYAFEIWQDETTLLAHAAAAPFRTFLGGLAQYGSLVASRRWIGALEPYEFDRMAGADG